MSKTLLVPPPAFPSLVSEDDETQIWDTNNDRSAAPEDGRSYLPSPGLDVGRRAMSVFVEWCTPDFSGRMGLEPLANSTYRRSTLTTRGSQ